MHGNTKRLPHNHLTDAVITNVTKILKNYAEENAILLPGRIPGHRGMISNCYHLVAAT